MKSHLAIIFIICLLIFALSGCASDYERYTVGVGGDSFSAGSGIPSFTFEYPRSFVQTNARTIVTDLAFERDFSEERFLLELIAIQVRKPDYEEPSSADVLYNLISGNISEPASDSIQVGDIQLLEKNTVVIDGIPAEYVAYSFRWLRWFGPPISYEAMFRRVSFEHAGFVWKLNLYCWAESDEETEKYFEHLIDTFEFLE